MSYNEIMKTELTAAAARFSKALKASEASPEREIITHKGKTLFSVNRECVALVKMTVGY